MNKNNTDVLFYKIIRPLIKGFVYIVFRPKIIRNEYINKNGPIILAGNHTSIFDCLLLISSTKREVHFLAKDELWKGFKKIIFSNLGLIPVNRRQKDHKALKEAIEYLKKDAVIGIFPEGTTEKVKGEMLPFKIGAVKMAYETGTKIIPFAIVGDYKLFSKKITIKFGEPFNVKSDNLDSSNIKLKNKIEELKNSLGED